MIRRGNRPGSLSRDLQLVLMHIALLAYTALAVFPVILVIINSFKDRLTIFGAPFALPWGDTFTLDGYATLGTSAHFEWYFLNSLFVTVCSLLLILIAGSMAAFALAEYKFRFNLLTSLYLSIGIMVPIRLGTVGILRLMVNLHLVNSLWALILIYTAQGIPLAIFVLTAFMRQVPRDLKDAARIDGAVIVPVEERLAGEPGGPRQALPRVGRATVGHELRTLRCEMIGADQEGLLTAWIPHQVVGVDRKHPARTVEVVQRRRDVHGGELAPLARLERGSERRE